MSLTARMEADARLVILKTLAARRDEGVAPVLNSTVFEEELKRFGIRMPREWVFAQLDYLAMMGAVIVEPQGSVRVATLTERGLNHVDHTRLIEGVGRPSLASVGARLIAESMRGSE